MNEKGKKSQRMNIQDLPNEVLAQVFKRVPFNQCEKMMTVCKRWESVIDELVGVRTYIGRPSEFWPVGMNDWFPIDKISQIGASTILFSGIEHSENQWEGGGEGDHAQRQRPSFKFPHLVRRVSFDGYVGHRTFTTLLEPIRNLAYLELHLSSLEDVDLTLVNLNFPKLQELIISSNNFTISHMESRNLRQIMDNCTNLLEASYFPRLVTLRLYIPIVVQRSARLLRALFHFLLRHNATMTMFLIRTEVTVSVITEEIEPVEPLDMIPEEILFKKHTLCLPILRANFRAGGVPFLDFFRRILNQQKKMTWCAFVTHEDFRPFPQHVIKQNYLSLQKLHLSISVVDITGNCISMNCAYLKDCVVLEQIGFIGNRTKENSENIIAPDLINAHLLPKTLKFVEIYNLLIEKQDVYFMSLNLPLVKTLHLENIGDQGDLGMTVETLVDIIREHQLMKIGIISGFNQKSLKSIPSTLDPAMKMARLLLGRDSPPTFVATLYEDGRMEWGYAEEEEKFI